MYQKKNRYDVDELNKNKRKKRKKKLLALICCPPKNTLVDAIHTEVRDSLCSASGAIVVFKVYRLCLVQIAACISDLRVLSFADGSI